MAKKPNTRPHPPSTPARKAGRVDTTHRPRPFYKKGGRLMVCPRSEGDCDHNEKLGGWADALRAEADAYAELAKRGWAVRKIAHECETNRQTVSLFVRVVSRYRDKNKRPSFWTAYQDVDGKTTAVAAAAIGAVV